MKYATAALILILTSAGVQADVQIKFRNQAGETSTMHSDGNRVRINTPQTSGYVVLDSPKGEFFIVDEQKESISKISTDEITGVPPDGGLSVSLKPRGSGGKVAGYRTGRFDLIANGLYCGTLNGSSELIRNPVLMRMLEAMQDLHKLSSRESTTDAPQTECGHASSQLADLVESSGFVLRYMDDQGKLIFEVLSFDFNTSVAADYYDLPPNFPVTDLQD